MNAELTVLRCDKFPSGWECGIADDQVDYEETRVDLNA